MWKTDMIILTIFLIALALYVLAVRGRTGHPMLQTLRSWHYAHRGLHNDLCPENSLSAFRRALDHGYGVELDVHLMADGNLAVIHDSSLVRTAGADVRIEDLRTEDLPGYPLKVSGETIPLFRQVLDLFDGKAPIIVELKPQGNNVAALTAAACKLLDSYHGPYCLESFDPRCILWLKQNRPELCRGQLSENWFRTKNGLPWILKLLLTNHVENFLTMPDFVAYKFDDRKGFGNFLARKIWGLQGVTWTVRSREDHEIALKEGWISIFENFEA